MRNAIKNLNLDSLTIIFLNSNEEYTLEGNIKCISLEKYLLKKELPLK